MEDGTRFSDNFLFTKLASFSGQKMPSTVTSVSKAIWVRLSLKIENSMPEYMMKISAVDISGK